MSRNIKFFRESTVDIPLDEKNARRLIVSVMKDLDRANFTINIISLEDEALREMKKEYFHSEDLPEYET